MKNHILNYIILISLVVSIAFQSRPAYAAGPTSNDNGWVYKGKVTQEEREAAAERFKNLFFTPKSNAQNLPAAFDPSPGHIIGANGLPIPHYFGPYPNYALSPLPIITRDPVSGNITGVTGGIRKFIDALPGLGIANKNNLDQYLPVAVADNVTYPGSDYYEIALVEVEEKMHTDLPSTRLRQYVQLSTPVVPGAAVLLAGPRGPILMPDNVTQARGVTTSQYLGPVIVTNKDRPVRVKFYNLLPTGQAGNLFIPVDTTVMGAGMGPVMAEDYTQNRATLHLHGGHTPWISDGTPHQWITPANENTPYPQGVNVYPVPDMYNVDNGNATDGSMTFYYTNQQSARFMFYHDHSFGITRLNVYAGEAAGYIIRDQVEQDLINRGIIPSREIPLVIQDKTFVTDNVTPFTNIFGTYSSQMAFYDPTWDYSRWGNYGDLWYPHVYMPVQNPDDPSGINAFGRWHYGPWFWPPTAVAHPPILNPYYGSNSWEPRYMPGVPNDSTGMESFFDTPVVNGTVYPYLEVEPQSYRFRILNAANDRFWNLQLHQADNTTITADNRTNTEIKMIPATGTLPDGWAADNRVGGLPDPTLVGPPMIQIGTEGGFLPNPVVLENTPIRWITDPAAFAVGNVEGGNLILGPAERADVIIDFSAFAGKTLILYNDAPAPYPALAPQYDYYTGSPDMTDTGSSPGTIAGWGPNTRTIMQIRVKNNPPAPVYNLSALNEEFMPSNPAVNGVFARGQDTIFVGQSAYDNIYHTAGGDNITFPSAAPWWGIANIASANLTFNAVSGNTTTKWTTSNVTEKYMEKKAIQDEMGEAFDPEYGRMSGFLGLEMPKTVAGAQNFMLYPFLSPPVDMIPIGNTYDGFEIWRITHNGVDVHPIHFHLYEVQLINRVAWDGAIYWPDPNELGWKETLRVAPLQDTIVALRPKIDLNLPFEVPNSVRLIDPTKNLGDALVTPPGGFLDVLANPVTVLNHYVNFGWEYVWHCHILSHEEMDMMHVFGIGAPPAIPINLSANISGNSANLTWDDKSANETHWTIQRGPTNTGPWTTINTKVSNTGPTNNTTIYYSDTGLSASGNYSYRVLSTNIIGDTFNYGPGAVGFPNFSLSSNSSNVASISNFTPAFTTVTITGMTASVPLVLDTTGAVQTTTKLTGGMVGANFTINIPSGLRLLDLNGSPLSTISFTSPDATAAQPNTQILVSGYTFGPSGATFNPGITLIVSYNPNNLPAGVLPANMNLAFWNGTTWTLVPGTVNTTANTVTVTLTHFTDFTLRGTAPNVNMGTGWNTLAVPFKLQAATDTWGEFATSYGLNFTAAYSWNGSAYLWVESTKELTPLDAIYVKLGTPATMSFVPYNVQSGPYQKNLIAGWNLIGSAFTDPTKAINIALTSAYLGTSNFTGYTQVISPSGINQNSWTYVRDAAVTIELMQMGKGYWLFSNNPATLAGFTTTP